MSNLVDIQSQIEKLQRQASEIKAKEFDKTVQDIVARMHAFGITVKDLQTAMLRSKAKASPSKRGVGKVKVKKGAGATVAAKYRGPNGETWSGRGLTPKWLVALVASGKPKEEFAIHH